MASSRVFPDLCKSKYYPQRECRGFKQAQTFKILSWSWVDFGCFFELRRQVKHLAQGFIPEILTFCNLFLINVVSHSLSCSLFYAQIPASRPYGFIGPQDDSDSSDEGTSSLYYEMCFYSTACSGSVGLIVTFFAHQSQGLRNYWQPPGTSFPYWRDWG